MGQSQQSALRITVQNVGGIAETSVALPEGVSVLAGRNATNRTSLLQALMAGLGSRQSSLKRNADEGTVTLEINGEVYTRTLTRRGDSVVFDGDPYLDDPELADLFAFLLEDNEARRAVARDADLREIIMRPIDTDSINDEIRECRQRRNEIEAEMSRLDGTEQELLNLEAERQEKQTTLEKLNVDLETTREQLDSIEVAVDESRTRKQELEAAFQRVRDARSELDNIEFDLETERSSLAELQSERETLRETVESIEEPDANLDRLTGRIDELRRRRRALDDIISDLGSVINFNEEMLEDSGPAIDVARQENTGAETPPSDNTPTDVLTGSDQTVCWTCGSEVQTAQIETTLDQLRSLRSERLTERSDLREEIQTLTDKRSSIRETRQQAEDSRKRLETVQTKIEATESRISDLNAEAEAKRSAIEELEAEAESIEIGNHNEALQRHREVNEMELRVERIEDEIEQLDAKIAEGETALARREEIEAESESIADRLTDLRTRVDRLEESAVEEFNEQMATVLDILNYENLDRIWIERRETEVREGRETVTRTRFELHIVRSSDDGVAYEDTIDHLSESEREVTGLVFALAGYLVHDVYEKIPVIILDSVEAIDSDRIARIIQHFRGHADFLVTALLPEDAAALPEDHAHLKQIE